MKIIVSKSELNSLQVASDNIIETCNNITSSEPVLKQDILEKLANIKNETYIKYKLFTNEFVITVSEEVITDYANLLASIMTKSVPLINAIMPILELCESTFQDIKTDFLGFTNKYSITPVKPVATPKCSDDDKVIPFI